MKMRDDVINVEISKKDLTTMEELPGAELTITDKDGKEIDRWVSSDKPHYIEKLPAGDYTLTEVKAPDGYALPKAYRSPCCPPARCSSLKCGRCHQGGNFQGGHHHKQRTAGCRADYHQQGRKVVEHWTSTDKPHYIEKLPAGEYTLTEITAPNGYEIAENISFTVLPNGDVQRGYEGCTHPRTARTADTAGVPRLPLPLIPQTGDAFPAGAASGAGRSFLGRTGGTDLPSASAANPLPKRTTMKPNKEHKNEPSNHYG